VILTTHPLLVSRLRKSWAITSLTLWVLLGLLRGSLYLKFFTCFFTPVLLKGSFNISDYIRSIELYYGYLGINVNDVEGSEHVLILGIVPPLVWNGSGRDACILVTIRLRLEIGTSTKQKSSVLIKIFHEVLLRVQVTCCKIWAQDF
jgi:hypothetical protein